MNFNAFFLDKLSETNNLMGSNTKKFNPNSYLFSNIIKVEEANSSLPLINQPNNQDVTDSETTTPTENVIHVSENEITQLSDFITQFISNTDKQLKSSEITQSPSSMELNKNKLILNEDGLNSLLEGIVQKITTQNQIYSKNINVNPIDTKDTENTKTVTRSLLNLLSQVNTLNLSFKSSSQKILINIVPDEQNAASNDINFTQNISGLINSVQNQNYIISKTDESEPTDKSSNTQIVQSEIKNSKKTDNNLQVDNSAIPVYNAEITQIFLPTENSAHFTSTDNLTNQLTNGNNSTSKFLEEYTSISVEQPFTNLFVQSSKSMHLGYSNLGISGNFISNKNLTPNDSSSNSNNQIPESSTIYTNKNPFIQTKVKQILDEDQSTTINNPINSTISTNKKNEISTDANGIIQSSILNTNVSSTNNLIASQESTDSTKLQTGLTQVNISSNDNLLSQLQKPSILTKIISLNQSMNQNVVTENNVKLKVTTNNQLENQDIISFNNLNSGLENKSTFLGNIENTNSDKARQSLNNDLITDISKQKSTNNFVNSVASESYSIKGNQQSDITPLQTTTTSTVGDQILKTLSGNSSTGSLTDTLNKSFSQKQIIDNAVNIIQKEISDLNQAYNKNIISQYSGKIDSANVSKAQSTTEETIKNLFNNRKVETNQINNDQTQTKDAIEQLKNVVGFSQSLRKLSFYDNSNTNQSTSDTSNNENIIKNDFSKDKMNEQNIVNHSSDNILINDNSSSAQSLNIKNTLSIKSNDIINADKLVNTEINEKYTSQSNFGNKDGKNQTDTLSNATKTIDQIKNQDNQKEIQSRSDTSTNDKNTTIDQIKNQDQQKNDSLPEAIVIDGNKALNLPVDSDAKTNREVKNSSKVGTILKDDGNKNSSDESTPIIDIQAKNQDDKDFQKQKYAEIVKNSPVQNSTSTNDFEIEKIKAFTDLKTVTETVKTIKVSEIIPEFSKVIQLNEKQSLTFQLTPDNLGKVKLVVDLVQNQINTRMVVENNQIKQFIQSNVEQLKQSLSSSGIDLNSVNISLANQEQKSNKSYAQRKKLNGKLESINPTDNQPALEKKVMGYNTYEYLV
jgi:flagellar hook-length control protein FliK